MSVSTCRARVMIELLEPRLQLTAPPTGFTETVVAANLGSPTAMDVLDDGRVLIADQLGALKVVKNNTVLATPFVSLTVNSAGERGLLGVTHDPNFAVNHFIYVYHTVPKVTVGTTIIEPHNAVTRYTANGDVAAAGSAVDILSLNPLSSATNHNGGAMHFGKDGMLYIAVGENANPTNSQVLTNLLGKVLRIDVSKVVAGDPVNNVAKLVPTNNPFVGQTGGSINGAIYALGFRNPFTFAVNSIDGTIYINDVGQNAWEEIDKLAPGGNYGWNKSEGYSTAIPPVGLGPGTYQQPVLAYNHTGGVAGGGIAIVGGAFYQPKAGATNPFPAAYIGKYFYGDLGGNWIRALNPATPGNITTPDTSTAFASDSAPNPVGFETAADGGLYYLARGNTGELVKISYPPTTTGVGPTITTGPAKTTTIPGRSETFSVVAAGPAPLNYQWQRNNGVNGAYVNITGATGVSYTTPTLALTDGGARFRVVVSNAFGTKTSGYGTLIVINDTAPVPTLTVTSGLRNGAFDAGTEIRLATSATDAEDGTIAYKYFNYKVDYVTSLKTVSGGVVRPFIPLTKGKNGVVFTPANTGPYTGTDEVYRVTFSAIDSNKIATTIVKDFSPNVVTLTLATNPKGLKLNVDGQPLVSPTNTLSVVGFSRLLDAPTSQVLNGKTWTFSSWSDNLPITHSFFTPAVNTTYIATYK